MLNNRVPLILLTACLCCQLHAQQWFTHYFPGNNNEGITALGQDPSGNFVTVSGQNGSAGPRIMLSKVSPDGELLQVDSTTYDINAPTAVDYFSIKKTDGSWAFCADYANVSFYFHVGDSLQLTQQPGFEYPYEVAHIMSNPINGIDMVAKPYFSNYPIRLIRMDAAGGVVWDTTHFSSPNLGAIIQYQPTADGGFLCGFWANFNPNAANAYCTLWLFKIGNDGSLEWTKEEDFDLPDGFQTNGYGNPFKLSTSGDHFYTMFAHYLIKFDMQGNIIWNKNYSDVAGVQGFYVDLMKNTTDGNILVVSKSNINNPEADPDFIAFEKISPEGELLGQRIIPVEIGSPTILIYILHFMELPDQSIVVGGRIGNFTASDNFLMKLSPDDIIFPRYVTGKVFLDENNNCQLDSLEPDWPNATLEFMDSTGTYYYQPNALGDYSAGVKKDSAIARISLGVMHPYFAPCSDSVLVAFNGATSATLDFPIKKLADCPLMEVGISTPFLRRCFQNYYLVSYCNRGTAIAHDASVTVKLDPTMIFLLASTVPDAISGNDYTFQLGDLLPGEFGEIQLDFTLDCSVQLGQYLCASVVAQPDTICVLTEAIMADIPTWERDCWVVQGSFDPNDKTAVPQPVDGDWVLHPDSTLKYVIRFQNTGTDTAFKVRILDTLSHLLDPLSVAPLAASHPVQWQILQNGVLEFLFDPIQLPDSTVNELASHGFVKFGIRPRQSPPLGTVIENRAAIYFDFNDPVITNTHTYRVDKPYGFVVQNFEGCEGDTLNWFLLSADFTVIDSTDVGDSVLVVEQHYLVHQNAFVELDTTASPGTLLFGQPIFSNTTMTQFLETVHGCDSVVVLNVNIVTNSQEPPHIGPKIECYPNPASNLVMLKWDAALPFPVRWKVYSEHGQLLDSWELDQPQSSPISLNFQAYPVGAYLVLLQYGNESKWWKVVRQ